MKQFGFLIFPAAEVKMMGTEVSMRFLIVCLSLIGLTVSCGSFRESVFPGNPDRMLPKQTNGVLLETPSDGRTAYSFYVPGTNTPVIYFHGNADSIGRSGTELAPLFAAGHELLIVEYPGYGRASLYVPSEAAIYADAEASIRRASEQFGLDTHRAVLLGYSLGTGVATEFAHRGYGSRMILMAPYTSIPAVGERRTVPLVPYLVLDDRFDTISKSREVRIPVLILHGTKDEAVPFDMGVTLSRTFPSARLVALTNAGHRLFSEFTGTGSWKVIQDFIAPATNAVPAAPMTKRGGEG
jgi:hypothetical protein